MRSSLPVVKQGTVPGLFTLVPPVPKQRQVPGADLLNDWIIGGLALVARSRSSGQRILGAGTPPGSKTEAHLRVEGVSPQPPPSFRRARLAKEQEVLDAHHIHGLGLLPALQLYSPGLHPVSQVC